LLVEKNNKLLILKAKCLEDIDDFNGALEEYKKILEISSKEIKAQLGMGDLLRRMFRYDEALECATKAMEIDAENINCYLLKSVIYKDIQKIEDSINVLDLGLKVKPNSEQANFNKSILLLQSGNFKEGWDLYEWRWRVNEWTSVPLKTSKPIWNGEKCETLYIWPEQGIGDEVMFSSIFDDVRSDVNKLIVKIDIRLKEVYERSFKNIKFIDSKQVLNEDEYDYHLPMGSLPKFYSC
jgi:tetratricopeptide (TPR) repeat protein